MGCIEVPLKNPNNDHDEFGQYHTKVLSNHICLDQLHVFFKLPNFNLKSHPTPPPLFEAWHVILIALIVLCSKKSSRPHLRQSNIPSPSTQPTTPAATMADADFVSFGDINKKHSFDKGSKEKRPKPLRPKHDEETPGTSPL